VIQAASWMGSMSVASSLSAFELLTRFGSKRSSPSIGDAIGSSIDSNAASRDASASYKKQVGTAEINNSKTVAIKPEWP
jgi:hypothetical protein